MSAWILVQSVLHFINSSLYFNCPFLSFISSFNLCWTMVNRAFMNNLWYFILGRLQFFKLLFQLFNFLLYILLLGNCIWISYWRFTFSIFLILFCVFSWSSSLFPLQSVHNHSNKFLIIIERCEIFNWRKVRIHLTIFFKM